MGRRRRALPSPTHPSQSDAESWLGETWRELAAAGIAQVTLLSEDGTLVYGPMPLTDLIGQTLSPIPTCGAGRRQRRGMAQARLPA